MTPRLLSQQRSETRTASAVKTEGILRKNMKSARGKGKRVKAPSVADPVTPASASPTVAPPSPPLPSWLQHTHREASSLCELCRSCHGRGFTMRVIRVANRDTVSDMALCDCVLALDPMLRAGITALALFSLHAVSPEIAMTDLENTLKASGAVGEPMPSGLRPAVRALLGKVAHQLRKDRASAPHEWCPFCQDHGVARRAGSDHLPEACRYRGCWCRRCQHGSPYPALMRERDIDQLAVDDPADFDSESEEDVNKPIASHDAVEPNAPQEQAQPDHLEPDGIEKPKEPTLAELHASPADHSPSADKTDASMEGVEPEPTPQPARKTTRLRAKQRAEYLEHVSAYYNVMTGPKMCRRCRVHDVVVSLKDHKGLCPFKGCSCDRCSAIPATKPHLQSQPPAPSESPPVDPAPVEPASITSERPGLVPKRRMCCFRCRMHGVEVPLRGHKPNCPHKGCGCAKCTAGKNSKAETQPSAEVDPPAQPSPPAITRTPSSTPPPALIPESEEAPVIRASPRTPPPLSPQRETSGEKEANVPTLDTKKGNCR